MNSVLYCNIYITFTTLFYLYSRQLILTTILEKLQYLVTWCRIFNFTGDTEMSEQDYQITKVVSFGDN